MLVYLTQEKCQLNGDYMIMKGFKIPPVTFRVRQGDEEVPGETGCPIGGEWITTTTDDYFKGKRVVLFSLPGAFTPTCSSKQLPGFEENYETIKAKGIDEIYCVSVNDSFVMNAWARDLNIKNVKMIPDGCGTFTRSMGMLVNKPAQGFGMRSWRYAAVIKNGIVENWFEEPGLNNSSDDDDPYTVSAPEYVLQNT